MTTASELERDIVRSFKRRQRYSTYLGILLVALITTSVAAFLAYSLREIASIRQQIYTLRQDKTNLEKSNTDLHIILTQTNEKLKEAQQKLAKSTDLADHVHNSNLE